MLTMRKGFSISFADKLSEGYKTDGKIFTANVSAQKTLPLLEDFIKLHENERLFLFWSFPLPKPPSLRTKTGISTLSTRIFIILTIAPPL